MFTFMFLNRLGEFSISIIFENNVPKITFKKVIVYL